jgi:RNA ligase (TIGR02306 family)
MRTLASIQVINKLEPIEGADAIERAQILGWSVVVKKNEFTVGEKVIYCEIDSVLPKEPEFEFLAKSKYRIKTIRLRGQISQGICFPTSIVSDLIDESFLQMVGQDITNAMGIVKYEPKIPACLGGIQKGSFPSHIPKTDETRVQTLQRMLTKYKGTESYISLKLEGSSATYCIRDDEFIVASRGMSLIEDTNNSFWHVARRDEFEVKLRAISEHYGQEVSIQGEMVGPGIQKNLLGLKQHEVYLFNLFLNDDYRYVDGRELAKVCEDFNLNMVPVLDWYHIIHDDVAGYIEQYNGLTHPVYQDKQIEGVVIRPLTEIHDAFHGRISFKIINNKYLLKHED